MSNNIDIHGLWIGKNLSKVELLCMQSFIDNGHQFHLWAYDEIETPLPSEVIIENAEKIIKREDVFCYKNKNQFGHGKGSYAGFSDVFRYKLLYEKGGWWVDMDVVCLKHLDFDSEYVFRTHHDFAMVGNIMKCPKGSKLMLDCYNEAYKLVDADNKDWNLPISILNKYVQKYGYERYIIEFTNPDSWHYLRKMFIGKLQAPQHWFAVHLLNEEWRRNKINKNAIPNRSFIGKLMIKHLKTNEYKFMDLIKNYYRFIFPIKLLFPYIGFKAFLKEVKWLIIRLFWETVRLVKKEKRNN